MDAVNWDYSFLANVYSTGGFLLLYIKKTVQETMQHVLASGLPISAWSIRLDLAKEFYSLSYNYINTGNY